MDKYAFYGKPETRTLIFGSTITLRRIQALKDIPSMDVKKFDLGGWVADEDALSQEGDCWVFEGSEVHTGGRVREQACVKGISVIGSGALVSGNSRIENSYVVSSSVVTGTAIVTKSRLSAECELSGDVVVDNSRLSGVRIREGEVTQSHVRSTKGILDVKHTLIMQNTSLQIYDEQPVIAEVSRIENVKADGMKVFRLNGCCILRNLTFPADSSLIVGKPHVETDFTYIESVDGQCSFEELDLHVTKSTIRGAVSLKGNLHMTDCSITDFASVLNDDAGVLELSDVNASEVSGVHKTSSLIAYMLCFTTIKSDTLITC